MHEGEAALAVERFGRRAVVSAVQQAVAEIRENPQADNPGLNAGDFAAIATCRLEALSLPKLKPVFNLTGVVLHTNLGRAVLAETAVAAAIAAMRKFVTLEFDVSTGGRGERDDHLRNLICELTGAEDATIVNNNAAAVMLVLNTLARDKESIISRGELIEIGGAFRLPEITDRAGTKLREVGTTNRTHEKDYISAIGPGTGVVLKVHTSNYVVRGFVAEVSARALSAISNGRNIPFVHDLGSGTLVDLSRWGLAHERTITETLQDGADLVTFSGDKLLGGPQAGFIVGKKELIKKINQNPMKRAMRVDKIRLAALEETLKLYRDPDRLLQVLPTLRSLVRPFAEIERVARRLAPVLSTKIGNAFLIDVTKCESQAGSGALPLETIQSAGISIRCASEHSGRLLMRMANALRRLPIPIAGRFEHGSILLDLRCLEEEAEFLANLQYLDVPKV
ncbi:L-seryl-tRNA(Sec) selenium transferase [Bradyrhizobium sp. Ash2021]|uniref:L-seryl-tRNA(Sec) selenium transferase n=1 Tax=Bradyrhizobium sp. Ash2021 TaxID=2954771 RepID=UPI0028164BE7|nr:L-seryl-tRNA(Sec) selenium transferase [Bradyrhizobium sp. Ash2021]WMT72058.1 L-seryl-tRNA(Sec) selenium transferase [Bradyrhizobium sp. Ash2021]